MPQRTQRSEPSARVTRPWRPWGFVRGRPWTTAALAVFVGAVAALVACKVPVANAVLIGFDLAASSFLGLLVYLFKQATPARMRHQAKAIDTGRWGVLLGGVVVSTVVLTALAVNLHGAREGSILDLVVGVLSVVLSWLFLNVMFAIHYAHGYYGDLGQEHQGLDFPGTREPDYWDFTYFAIVIGMTFQVSDVQITSNYLRRVALLHSVIAFFFNVFIIAITVNIVAGKSG